MLNGYANMLEIEVRKCRNIRSKYRNYRVDSSCLAAAINSGQKRQVIIKGYIEIQVSVDILATKSLDLHNKTFISAAGG